MEYTKILFVKDMKTLELFDNISYKYIKDFINDDDSYIDVEIEDLECNRIGYSKTKFTFELDISIYSLAVKKFVVEKRI